MVVSTFAGNGVGDVTGWTLPLAVMVKLLVLLSMNVLLWHVSKLVFVMLVSGAVGGVKLAV